MRRQRRQHDTHLLFDSLAAQSLGERIDLHFGGGRDADGLGHRQQAAQGSGNIVVDRRVGPAAGKAGGIHLRRRQPCAGEDHGQPATHVDLETRPLDRLDDPAAAFAEQRRLWKTAGERHRHFLEGDDAARPQIAGKPAQGCGRIGQIHQDEPADHRIEGLVGRECIKLTDSETCPVTLAGFGGAPLGNVYSLCRAIDAEHSSRGPDQLPGQQGDVADAAANVEHAHARSYPRAAQDMLRKVVNERSLQLQALEFAVRVTQGIGTRIRCALIAVDLRRVFGKQIVHYLTP